MASCALVVILSIRIAGKLRHEPRLARSRHPARPAQWSQRNPGTTSLPLFTNGIASWGEELREVWGGSRAPPSWLNVEVLHVEGVLLDEAPPGLDQLAHQRGEQLVRLEDVVHPDLE